MEHTMLELVLRCCEQHNAVSERKVPVERGVDAPLYGGDGALDSLSLVRLIVAIEQDIEDRFGAIVTLADEKAVSLRGSPFRTAGKLAEYAEARVEDERRETT